MDLNSVSGAAAYPDSRDFFTWRNCPVRQAGYHSQYAYGAAGDVHTSSLSLCSKSILFSADGAINRACKVSDCKLR